MKIQVYLPMKLDQSEKWYINENHCILVLTYLQFSFALPLAFAATLKLIAAQFHQRYNIIFYVQKKYGKYLKNSERG